MKSPSLIALMVLLAGCNTSGTSTTAKVPTTKVPDAVGDIAAIRKQWPKVTLGTHLGPQTFYYRTEGGLAFAEGDILLGPAELIDDIAADKPPSPAFALATSAPDALWPGGVVPFLITDDAPHQAEINRMILEYEARTPIRFVPRTNQYHYMRFVASPINNYGQIGRQWWGRTLVGISSGLPAGATAETVIVHEIGHGLGLFHEHTRSDRDNFVTINWSCINPLGAGNFLKHDSGDSVNLEVYDTASVMHYFPTAFSLTGTCATISPRAGVPPISRTNSLSVNDVNALWKLYGDFGSNNREGDMFGRAVVAADFDADGYTDLAVGAPQKTIDGQARRGAVYMFKGTDTVLVPWGMLDFSDRAVPAARDRFGHSLATGDFNNDGVPDLAVGVPGRDEGRGAVAVFRGQRRGPLSVFSFHRAASYGLSQFGYGGWGVSLAVGDTNNDGFVDIAAGAPFGLSPDWQVNSGYVYILRGTALGHDTGLVLWERSSLGDFGSGSASESDDRFGVSLRMADWDGDGFADLAVGASRDRVDGIGSGSVFLFSGTASGPQADRRLTAPDGERTALSSFGASIASFDWDGDGREELAVGAPGADVDGVVQSGKVYLVEPTQPDMIQSSLDQSGLGTERSGDSFGISLHTGDLDGDGDMDLVVGATSKTVGNNGQFRPGMGMGFRVTASGFVPWFRLSALSLANDENLGIGIASGDFDNDGQTDIAVGSSLSRFEEPPNPASGVVNLDDTPPPAAGVVHAYTNFAPAGGTFAPTLTLHQAYRWRRYAHETPVNP